MENPSSRSYLTHVEALRYLKVNEEDLNYRLLKRKIRQAVHPLELAVDYSRRGCKLFLSHDRYSLYTLDSFSEEVTRGSLIVDIPEFLYFHASDVESSERTLGDGDFISESYVANFETFDGSPALLIKLQGDTYSSLDVYLSRNPVYTIEELDRYLSDSGVAPAQEAGDNKRKANTRLRIIAALCQELEIDRNTRGAAAAIQLATEKLGNPVGEDTVRKVLKEISELLDDKPN